MKKVLILHQSAELYGSDKTLLILLSGLDKTLFFPVVILPSNGPLKNELEQRGIEVVVAPVLKIYRSMFTVKNLYLFVKDYTKAIRVVKNLDKKYKFDIIYSNTLAVLLGMFYARKTNLKHIWHVHEIIESPRIIAKLFPVLLNKFADIIICNSKATKQNLVQRKQNLRNKIEVIYNGLTIQPLHIVDNRKDFGFKENDIIVTLVGRISRLKGHKWLLNTYLNNIKKSDNIKLLLVGSPVHGQEFHLDELVKFVKENGLENHVKLLPYTQNLNPVWCVTDIAVVPSTEPESFGLVAAEAMLWEKPVVASNLGGLKEIVVHNETGFLVEPYNSSALASSVLKLALDPYLRKTFGINGRERVIQEFSAENYIAGISRLIADN